MSIFRKYTFKGGIHPKDSKNFSEDKEIEILPLPKKVYLPLQQHIGVPAQPLVKAGDTVKAGELIGKAQSFVSANIHSSVTGKVIEIGDFMTPIGRRSATIVIETTSDDVLDEEKSHYNVDQMSKEELLDMVSKNGIVGLGGATFPTAVKLSPPKGKIIEYLIIDGAECEPFLTCDYRLMVEKSRELIIGTQIIQKILGVSKVYFGIEKNKPYAIQAMKKEAEGTDIKIIPLEVKYPQGAEKQLIHAITKQEVPSGGLPIDVAAVVQNVGTAYAVYEAVMFNKPLIERVLTVSGTAVEQPKNLRVKLGTPISEVIDFCGGLTEDVSKVINGGPMMGISLFNLDVPVIKGTSGILALSHKESKKWQEGPCISCGGCVDVSPMHLVPTLIIKNTKKSLWQETQKYHVMDCIECGSCAYVCPAKINLVHYIKFAKSELIAIKKSSQMQKGV